jgi:hypothetical protein
MYFEFRTRIVERFEAGVVFGEVEFSVSRVLTQENCPVSMKSSGKQKSHPEVPVV